jgi:hypothetical protein
MKKVVTIIVFAVVLVSALVSCGSTKHAGKCDAYSLNKNEVSNQDLASK